VTRAGASRADGVAEDASARRRVVGLSGEEMTADSTPPSQVGAGHLCPSFTNDQPRRGTRCRACCHHRHLRVPRTSARLEHDHAREANESRLGHYRSQV